MSPDPVADTPRDMAETTGWRLPRRVRLALWAVVAAALVLLALALHPLFPLVPLIPTASPTNQDSTVLECRFQSTQMGGMDSGSTGAGLSAHPGDLLWVTWAPTCTSVVEANPQPSPVTLQLLLFGPFASQSDRQQFMEDTHPQASQPTATQATPGVDGFGSWPRPPCAVAVQQAQSNVDVPVTVRLSLPTDLSSGLYAMYEWQLPWARVPGGWTTDGGAGGAAPLAVTAGATSTATPRQTTG